MKVSRKAPGKACVSYSFFSWVFFLSWIVTPPQGTASHTRAPVPGWLWGQPCWCPRTQRTQPPKPGAWMSGSSACHRRVPGGRSAPRTAPQCPFLGAVWTVPSSSWRRITQDLITTTWWQPSERSPSLSVMVLMLRLARGALKMVIAGNGECIPGERSLYKCAISYILSLSICYYSLPKTGYWILSLAQCSQSSGFMVRSATAASRKTLKYLNGKDPLIASMPFFLGSWRIK